MTLDQLLLELQRMNDYEDLITLNRAVVSRIKNLSKRTVWKFRVGDKVSWFGKHGHKTGVVVRSLTKNVLVDANDGRRWRIPAAMLKNQ